MRESPNLLSYQRVKTRFQNKLFACRCIRTNISVDAIPA
jgi:hypothetical protein